MLTTPEQGDGDVTVRRARASRINRGGKRGVKSLCQLKLNSSVLSIISSQSRREQRQGAVPGCVGGRVVFNDAFGLIHLRVF